MIRRYFDSRYTCQCLNLYTGRLNCRVKHFCGLVDGIFNYWAGSGVTRFFNENDDFVIILFFIK